MSELILIASACRTTITEAVQTSATASLPAAGNWGCESASSTSKYVASISTDAGGVITVTAQAFGDATIDTKTLTLTPTPNPVVAGTQITGWTCGGSVPAKFRPGSCK